MFETHDRFRLADQAFSDNAMTFMAYQSNKISAEKSASTKPTRLTAVPASSVTVIWLALLSTVGSQRRAAK